MVFKFGIGVPKFSSSELFPNQFTCQNRVREEIILTNKLRGGSFSSFDESIVNSENDTDIKSSSFQNTRQKSNPSLDDSLPSSKQLVPPPLRKLVQPSSATRRRLLEIPVVPTISTVGRVPKLNPMPKFQDRYDFERAFQVEQAITRNMCPDYSFGEKTKPNELVDSFLDFLAEKTVETLSLGIERLIIKGSDALVDKVEKLIAEAKSQHQELNSAEFHAYLEKLAQDKLKVSMEGKTRRVPPSSPKINLGKPTEFARSTLSNEEPLNVRLLGFEAYVDTYQSKVPFGIAFGQTKEKWYHFLAYPELKRPRCLPLSIENPEILTKNRRNTYKTQLTNEEVNNIQWAIKSFCLNEKTQILHPGLFKTEKTKEPIEGTFFVNDETRQFVFFKKDHNRYVSGWRLGFDEENDKRWNRLMTTGYLHYDD